MIMDQAEGEPRLNIYLLPICVSQGDAIFICIEVGNDTKYCYLVDGGTGSKTDIQVQPISRGVDNLPGLPTATSISIPGTLDSNCSKLLGVYDALIRAEFLLKGIIMTHPDEDHYGGARYLFQYRNIDCPVLITNQFLIEACKNRDGHLEELLQVMEKTHGGHLMECNEINGFPSCFEFYHPLTSLVLYEQNAIHTGQRPNPLLKFYKRIDKNETSIITTIIHPTDSKPLACLTGDAVLTNQEELNKYFTRQKANIPVFLVPHHGSENNSSIDLYENVNSSIYIISCGSNSRYQFPHANTLKAICEASFKRKTKAKIVLTNGQWLASEKMSSIESNWLEYISIYYWDEKVYKKSSDDNDLMCKPFLRVSLCPSPPKLIGIDDSVFEWSISGYYKLMTRFSTISKCFIKCNEKFIAQTKDGKIKLNETGKKLSVLTCPSPTHPCNWEEDMLVTVIKNFSNDTRLVFLKKKPQTLLDEYVIYISLKAKEPWKVKYGNKCDRSNEVCWTRNEYTKLDLSRNVLSFNCSF